MGTLEIRHQLVMRVVRADWPQAQRLLFRFVFAYFVLYNLFGGNSLFGQLWDPLVLWVGELVFGVEITIRPLGSGDTTWSNVQVFCLLVVAVSATVLWTLLDRKRSNYSRLHEWLRVFMRLSLAFTMIFYGAMKAIPSQMPSPALETLVQPMGEASPMRLLWTFMGASSAYCIFTGVAEMLGGLLLVSRRTTLLGALISLGVLSNVVMLNFCYDVPVKLLSSHLLLMSIFLIAPDVRRLADLFVFQRRVEKVEIRPLFANKGLHYTALALRTGFFGLVTVLALLLSAYGVVTYGALRDKPPLHGIWKVEDFTVEGKVQPPLLTDSARWYQAIFDYPGLVTLQGMDASKKRYKLQLDAEKRTLELFDGQQTAPLGTFTFEQPEPGLLVLHGTFDQRKLEVKLRLVEAEQFLLMSRGFHWINEFPFNR